MRRRSLGEPGNFYMEPSTTKVLNDYCDKSVTTKLALSDNDEGTISWEELKKLVLEELVKLILEEVEKKDGRFKLKRIDTGSYYDKTKVIEPNEFDIMLEMTELKLSRDDQYDSEEDNLRLDPPLGYTTFMIDEGEEIEWRKKGCIARRENLLKATKLKALFARYVREVIKRMSISQEKGASSNASDDNEEIGARSHGPAVTLKVTHKGKTCSIDLTLANNDESCAEDGNGDGSCSNASDDIEKIGARSHGPAVTLKVTHKGKTCSIDLTLAIKDESWPEDADEWKSAKGNNPFFCEILKGWPPRHLVDEIVRDGCHLVGKRPRFSSSTSESEYLWRYSFSTAEMKLVSQLEPCWIKVLRILKALRERKHLNLDPLTSYHLKTIMLYEREENPDPGKWTDDQVSVRFRGALDKILLCLNNRSCPHYFIRDVNLFDDRLNKHYEGLTSRINAWQENPKKVLREVMEKIQ